MYDYGRRNRRHETENPMIKLIATDVDGTLVKDGTMQIDPEYMTVIKELVQKGIIFAVCSAQTVHQRAEAVCADQRSAAFVLSPRLKAHSAAVKYTSERRIIGTLE